jgi:pimeloyl-ACP methyl ester carboxylesterase
MPMAWTGKYERLVNFLQHLVAVVRRGVSFLGRTRSMVGIGILSITLLAFTLIAETDQQGLFSIPRNFRSNVSAPSAINDSSLLPCFARDTVYFVPCNGKSIRVEIRVARLADASTRRKMLLLLPGWNYADTQWYTRTRVCDEARNRGYDVMLVEMGKSVYMDSLYPQMRADYRMHPTRTWLWDSVLKPLQKRHYFTDRGIPEDPVKTVGGHVYYRSLKLPVPTYVMGLSTGARGALLLALEHPEAFRGCAGLSGDYNPLLMKNDNLMINCLGKFDEVPWRWRGTNNIEMRVDALQVPLFLAHGTTDKVVPWQQTESLFKAMESSVNFQKRASTFNKNHANVGLVRTLFVKGAGHNYSFWNEAGLKALDYFDDLL